MFCLFSRQIYFSFGISISLSSVFECDSFEAFWGHFEIIVIWSAILFPMKSLISSEVFWIALFKAFFIACVVDI